MVTIIKLALRIAVECYKGARQFKHINKCATVFGSARLHEDHPYYKLAQETSKLLAEAGYTIMTGAGPGVMEAANRGAREGHGASLGCHIKLPLEQGTNKYLDDWFAFKYFFIRKFMLTKHSKAFVIGAGGYGTLDELFEVLTLIQTGRSPLAPVVLLGRKFWRPLVRFIETQQIQNGVIEQGDLKLYYVTDSPKAAVEYIKNFDMRLA